MSFIQEELKEVRDKNLYRKLRGLRPAGPVTAIHEGREILLFCGNDYLGLTHHPRVIKALKKSVEEQGAGAGAARLISGTSEEHVYLEKKIAEYKNKEKALVFSAGYLANLGVLSALAGEGDLVLMDKLCHASLVDGARLSGAEIRVFPHGNYERAEDILKTSKHPKKILVSDTLFSMDGDLANIAELVRLKQKYTTLLVLDDAHVTGVYPDIHGNQAVGPEFLNEVDVVTGTLSKAAGLIGGFAAGSAEIVEYLINFSRPFIFATALPPAICRAATEAFEIMKQDPLIRKRLWENTLVLKAGFRNLGIEIPEGNASPILPVLLGAEEKALAVSEKLLEEGVLVPAVRYPTVPKGKARLRVTVSAAHGHEDLQKLLDCLRKALS